MPSQPVDSPSESIVDAALERAVEVELQSRHAEYARVVSRSLMQVAAALSVTLVGMWLLFWPAPQLLIYAGLLLLMALGARTSLLLQRRDQMTAGLLIVEGISLLVLLFIPPLLPSLNPAVSITLIIAMMVAMLLGDRGSRWWVRAFVLAYLVDVVGVDILGWSLFPPLEHNTEVWITGAVSLAVTLMAVRIMRLIILGSEQQFRRAQRINLELERRVHEVNQIRETLDNERHVLRALIDAIPANVYIKDKHSRFVNANLETALQMGARTPTDLVGKTDFDFYTAELAAQYFADDQAVIQSAQPLLNSEESTFDQRTGQNRWLLTTKAPVHDERGEVTGLVGVSLDITERKQAEQTLHAKAEEEHRFQASLKALHEITLELAQIDPPDNFYRRVVELARERLGFDRFGLLLHDAQHARLTGTYGTDPQGNVVAEHHLQYDLTLLWGNLKRTLDPSERFAYAENTRLFSNLEPIGFGWHATATLWNGDQSLGWVSTDNAILHQPASPALLEILSLYAQTVGALLGRKHAEEARRESEARFRAVMHNALDAIISVDEQGKIIFWNQAAETMFGYSVEEVAGKTPALIMPERLRQAHQAGMERFLTTRQASVIGTAVELVGLRRGGSEFPIELSLASWEAGGETFFTSVLRDITERKQAETQAFALAAEQQRIMLLRDFIRDVSHDLRTPLSIIEMSSFLLVKTPDPAKRTLYSQRIEEQISRLKLLLDSFVELADLEQQASSLEFQAVDLDALVKAIAERSQPEVSAKHQWLEYHCELPSALVVGDPSALSKAICQVVDNAIHFTPAEGVITLHLYNEGDHAVIEVTDTGIGIPAADLPHIFDSFYRVDSARSTQSGGAGLGLSMAKKIVELLKGRIEVESRLGEGSVFKIYLPSYP